MVASADNIFRGEKSKNMKTPKIIYVLLFFVATLASERLSSSHGYKYSGDGYVSLYNTHSGEREKIKYLNDDREHIDNGVERINELLRCRLTGEVMRIDLKLVNLIDHLQEHFGDREITVISGYRSPSLNGMLSRKSGRVGKQSFHMRGKAIDIRIEGVSTKKIRDYALSLKLGGVGYYRSQNFVHVDVGPVRSW